MRHATPHHKIRPHGSLIGRVVQSFSGKIASTAPGICEMTGLERRVAD